jgi:hypothetical protein
VRDRLRRRERYSSHAATAMWRDVAYRPSHLCYLGAKAVSIGAKHTSANAFSRFLRGKTAARFSAFCNGQIVSDSDTHQIARLKLPP